MTLTLSKAVVHGKSHVLHAQGTPQVDPIKSAPQATNKGIQNA
jgi:hypothetical protein